MTTEQYRKRSGFSIFLSFFKPHRGLFFLDMACALVVSMIDLAYPIISRYAMRTLLPQSAYRTFFTIMLIVLAAYALRSVLYFIITYWGHTFGIRVEADIRAALFGHMQELGFEFFDRNRTGQLMSRMTTDLFEITELAHHGPEDLFISSITILGAFCVMLTIRWELALIVFGAGRGGHDPGVYRDHRLAPQGDARGLPPREEKDRRDQRRHRICPLRHPHGQGVCQRTC